MNLGRKIRNLRKERNMTIKDLSEKAGLSSGMISQIERDKIGISVSSLWEISQALDVSIGYFFDEIQEEKKPVVKRDQRKKIQLADSSAIYELLTPDLKGRIEFLRLVIESGESNDREQIGHEGEECGIVLQGKLLIKYGKKEYVLEAGDSIRLDSSVPHRHINIGEETSISIWAMTPPSF